jgi:hypothetical protein
MGIARPDEALLEFESLCLVAITADFPYLRIAASLSTHVTAREPSPTVKPTRLVEPARMSPGGEDSGEGGFEGAGFAVFQGPSAAAEGVDAGEDVAEVVAGDGFGKPGAAGVRADEDEGRGDTEDFVGVVGLGVVGIAVGVVGAEGDGFQAGRAVDGGDFDAFVDGDVFGGASVVFAPFWDQYRRQQC